MKRIIKIIKLLDNWKLFLLLAVGGFISELLVVQFVTQSRVLTLNAIVEADASMFFRGLILFVVSSLAAMLCVMFFDYNALKIPQKMAYDLKKRLIGLYLSNITNKEGMNGHENVMIRFEKDVEKINGFFEPVFLSVSTLGRTIGALIIGLQISWELILIVAILGFVNFFIIQKRVEILYEVRNELGAVEESIFRRLTEFIKNQFMIKIMGNISYIDRMRSDINRSYKHNIRKIGNINAVSSSINGFVYTLTTVLIVGVGTYLISIGRLNIGGLVAMLTIQGTLMDPYRYFEMIIDETANVFSAYKRIDELVLEFESGKNISDETENYMLNNKYSLHMDSVYFGYKNQPEILKNFHLSLEDHEMKYLWGRSGIGKSTVLKLILGAEKPHAGEIYMMDDENRKTVSRKNINYVSSQPICFNGSFYENIAMSDDPDYERATMCAKQAGLDKDIMKLDGGYETVIRDNGNNLSGGQKARLAMARAFYRDRKIYLIDEIFASLDDKNAQLITEAISKRVNEGHSALIITHRKEIIPEERMICNL